jgi:hypothetical protein
MYEQGDELKVAYRKAWVTLKDYFLKDPFRKIKDEHLKDEKKIKKYEKDLPKQLSNLLEKLIIETNKGYSDKFHIGRGIIQLNSLISRCRIRIPLHGSTENWESEQANWLKSFSHGASNKNGRELMYLQPDKPNHLLTELMWRFQSRRLEDPEIIAFAIFKPSEESDKLIKAIENSTLKKIKYVILYEDSLTNRINSTLNEFNKNVRANFPKIGNLFYNSEDIRILLDNPYKILYDKKSPYPGASNIFYISDINESNYLGAFDFELIISDTIKGDIIPDIVSFIEYLRWNLSKYIFGLINVSEREFYSEGNVYREVYFSKTNSTKKDKYSGLKEMETVLAEISKHKILRSTDLARKPGDRDKIIKIIDKLKNHFQIANSDIGLYWKGYKRSAFEVGCCAAGIIDELFLNEDGSDTSKKTNEKNFILEKTLRKCGPELNNFFKDIEEIENDSQNKIPFIFKQLFQGLVREKDLFLLPYYRDHFIHSFYCFCFGIIVMAIAPENIIPKKSSLDLCNEEKPIELIKKWFIVSMWHDIAYALEKGNSIIEKYILMFLQNKNKRFKKVLPWTPSLGNLMQIEGVLDDIRSISQDSFVLNAEKIVISSDNDAIYSTEPNTLRGIKVCDILIAVAFDRIDHGIWSSLFMNHALNEDQSVLQKHGIIKNEITKAIMPHHFSNWNYSTLLEDFRFYRHMENREKLTTQPFHFIYQNVENNPLGYLLCLCDMLSQAGREANEIADDLPSNLQIKYKGIKWHQDSNILEFSIEYNDSSLTKEEREKYYDTPTNFLSLEFEIVDKDSKNNSFKRNCIKLSLYYGNDLIDHKHYYIYG